jgi:hypothetical protein
MGEVVSPLRGETGLPGELSEPLAIRERVVPQTASLISEIAIVLRALIRFDSRGDAEKRGEEIDTKLQETRPTSKSNHAL